VINGVKMITENNNFKFHHIGLAVHEPKKGINFLLLLGYNVGNEIFDNTQNVFLRYCTHTSMPPVELIYGDENGFPLKSILSKKDDTIYHLCFEIQSIDNLNSLFSALGVKAKRISNKTYSILFKTNIIFYYIPGMGLTEFVEGI